jgi:hypothetical protein
MVTLKVSLCPRLDIKKNRTNSISPKQEKKNERKGLHKHLLDGSRPDASRSDREILFFQTIKNINK